MKNVSKTLLAAALLASAGSASASIATGVNAELYMQVYDSVQKLTFDLDLGKDADGKIVTLATMQSLAANATLRYDLSGDSNWQQFTAAGLDAGTKFGILAGNSLKNMYTSNRNLPAPAASGFATISTNMKNQADRINLGAVANTALNVSKLVANSATVGTGQWAAGSGGANPLSTIFGSYSNADAAILYGTTGKFYLNSATATTVTSTLLGYWTLAGNSLTFSVKDPSAVPVPAAAWLFGTGLLGLLGLKRRGANV